MQAPTPEGIVAAAEGMRDFFAAPVETENTALRSVHEANRKLFEESVGHHLRRFQIYERGRLPIDDVAPDLEPPMPEMRP
jgi:hypothetical protein